jgi:TorA maturation chaperone TorD
MIKIINELKNFEKAFSALANLMSFPNKETFKEKVFDDESILAFRAINQRCGLIVEDLKHQFEKLPFENLIIEYTRLFIGPFKLIAPPYGSYYMDGGRLMGDSTVEVMKLYDLVGLSINKSFKDLPDHIIAELEFIYFLILNEIKLISEENEIQFEAINAIKKKFFNNYFKSWVPEFSNLIIGNSKENFYKNTGELLKYFSTLMNFTDEEYKRKN